MSTAKQRIIVLAGLVVLLIAAPILNYTFNNSQDKNPAKSTKPASTGALSQTDSGSITTGNFFVDYVTERNQKRTEEVKYLDSIINDTKTDAETKKTAQKQKTDITLSMERELSIENLLKAKNFAKVAVVYHPGSVNVIIGKAELTEAEVAQILDITRTETGEKAESIKIIPVK
jgi:stage III sporulation protein AH